MKLKSLLAIVSCSAIALSISLPSVAETVRDSKVESGSIVIGNKDYRNKQSTPSIVGSWKSSVVDNEYKHVNPTEINIDIKSDNTIIYAFQTKKGNSFRNHTYKYSYAPNETGIWIQKPSEGTTTISSIKWISDNEFVQTLIKDSGHPERSGLQRRYIRQQKPVATLSTGQKI
ncbi:MAG: hypothetical protein AAFR63_15295 [Cyanobacteria bacterium J06631_6]